MGWSVLLDQDIRSRYDAIKKLGKSRIFRYGLHLDFFSTGEIPQQVGAYSAPVHEK